MLPSLDPYSLVLPNREVYLVKADVPLHDAVRASQLGSSGELRERGFWQCNRILDAGRDTTMAFNNYDDGV